MIEIQHGPRFYWISRMMLSCLQKNIGTVSIDLLVSILQKSLWLVANSLKKFFKWGYEQWYKSLYGLKPIAGKFFL